jgi:hypothetical protein
LKIQTLQYNQLSLKIIYKLIPNTLTKVIFRSVSTSGISYGLKMANVGVLKLGNISLEKTALFVCDLQEKFQPAIAHFADIVEVTKRLVCKCLL